MRNTNYTSLFRRTRWLTRRCIAPSILFIHFLSSGPTKQENINMFVWTQIMVFNCQPFKLILIPPGFYEITITKKGSSPII